MVYQVMEAMDVGDAVSSIARRNGALLAELGQPGAVLARYAHPGIGHETRPCHEALATPDCGLIFHYWGQNSSTWMLHVLCGRKAVHYHNITPPHFFPRHSDLFRATMRGHAQLRQIADVFDLILGDTAQSTRALLETLAAWKRRVGLVARSREARQLAGTHEAKIAGDKNAPRSLGV